jgi:hypothetical protein
MKRMEGVQVWYEEKRMREEEEGRKEIGCEGEKGWLIRRKGREGKRRKVETVVIEGVGGGGKKLCVCACVCGIEGLSDGV